MIAPQASAAFVAAMEMVLDIYSRPIDAKRPVVCMDETPRQLIRETREPIAATPGWPGRHDCEYERCGVCNVFMAGEPLAGRRLTKVTERRTNADWAVFVQDIAASCPDTESITRVMDNLNTHSPGSLCEAFTPKWPRRCGTASSSSTHPGMAAGSIWPRSRSTLPPVSE